MADLEDLQQFELELDLEGIPKDQVSEVKAAIGGYLVDSILEKVARGFSPVDGYGKFAKLDKKYAQREKGGNTLANLELEGDLLSSLGFKNSSGGVVVGIMESSQRPKADGHNNFSGDSKLPERRFIPGGGESFASDIQGGVDEILEGFRVEQTFNDEPGAVSDILSNESIADILLRRLNQ